MEDIGKVSVIMPVFNGENTINETIESVFCQTYGNFEILLVSDDLKDYRSIINREDKKIRFLSTGGYGLGASSARNVGLLNSTGKFIASLDADDLMYPTRLEKLVPLANKFGAASDNTALVDYESDVMIALSFPMDVTIADPEEVMEINRPLFPVYKRDCVTSWPENIKFAEDVLFNITSILRAGSLAIHQESLSAYRIRAGSVSNSADSHLAAEQSYQKILQLLDSNAHGYNFPDHIHAKLIKMFIRKRHINKLYTESLKNGIQHTFAEFAKALPTESTGIQMNYS